jgi:serine/threonine protein kinase
VYVVMPFIEGEVLSDRTHRLGQITLEETARLVTDIAAGVHLAHGLQIIHRDLKPENVMVCRHSDGNEYGVVMDFGLAKERKAEGELRKLTATGIILGTPAFMSPEQLRGKPIDPRSDIYALGLMAYEMLTGKLPFQGRTQQEMVIARLRSEPIPLREARPDLEFPAPVERVLTKAMQRNADDRHQTAIEFAQAFHGASEGRDEPPPPEDDGLLGKLFGH